MRMIRPLIGHGGMKLYKNEIIAVKFYERIKSWHDESIR